MAWGCTDAVMLSDLGGQLLWSILKPQGTGRAEGMLPGPVPDCFVSFNTGQLMLEMPTFKYNHWAPDVRGFELPHKSLRQNVELCAASDMASMLLYGSDHMMLCMLRSQEET